VWKGITGFLFKEILNKSGKLCHFQEFSAYWPFYA